MIQLHGLETMVYIALAKDALPSEAATLMKRGPSVPCHFKCPVVQVVGISYVGGEVCSIHPASTMFTSMVTLQEVFPLRSVDYQSG